MRKKLSLIEWPTEVCQELQFLEMSKTSEVQLESVTSLQAAFHAKTSVLPEMEKAWQDSVLDYSTRLSGLQKKYVRLLCSSKTCQQLELEDFEKSSEHLPKSGMTVDGRVYLPLMLEPITSAKGGSYLPTPATVDTGSMFNKSASSGAKLRPTLGAMARFNLWPTPTVDDAHNVTRKSGAFQSLTRKVTSSGQTGGQLNPIFVEWLMNVPLGWTELKPLETE